jgi:TonB-dependent receptor
MSQTVSAPAADDTVVVVRGIRSSLRSAMAIKRDSNQVQDSITATDIGKFPDKNLSEALQRVTGVQISRQDGEGRSVTIRGSQPNLVRTEIDGATALPLTVGAGDRAVDFRDLPVEFVGRIDVIKATLPQDTEGGIGGTVRVVMRKPFDSKKPFFAASAQEVYSTTAKAYDPKFAIIASRLFANDTIGVLVGANYEDRHFYTYKDLQTGWVNTLDLNSDGIKDFRPDITRPDIEHRLTQRSALTAVVEWRPSDTLQFFVEANFARGHEKVQNQLLQLSASAPDLTGIDLTKTTFNPVKDASGALTVNHIELISTAAKPMQLQYRNIDGSLTRNQSNWIVGGKWLASDKLTLDGRYSYASGKVHNDERDSQASIINLPRASIDFNNSEGNPNMQVFADAAGATKLDVTTGNLINVLDATYTPTDANVTERDAKFNVEYRPDSWLNSLKFGMEDHDTTTQNIVYSRVTTLVSSAATAIPGAPTSSGNKLVYQVGPTIIPGIVDANATTNSVPFFEGGDLGYSGGITAWNNNGDATLAATLAAAGVTDNNNPYGTNPNANTGSSYRQWLQNFTLNEKTSAVYFQASFAFPFMGLPVSGVIGDRVVTTKTLSTGFGQIKNGSALTFVPVSQVGKYTNDLPALNLKFEFIPKDLIGRFDIGKVMSRPEPNQLSFAQSLDIVGLSGTQGNPNLKPYLATNIDLGLEKYVNQDTFISATAFTKAISRYITKVTTPVVSNGVTYQVATPVNGTDRVKIHGVEVGGQTALTFLPAPFDDLGILANVTLQKAVGYNQKNLIDGTPLEFPGVSKTSYNAALYFENDLISARLSYNWRSRWLINAVGRNNSPEYNNAYGTVDGSFDYNLTPKLTLFVDGVNITNQPYIQENSPIRRIQDETDGSRVFFGVRFKN